eukprot:2487224-Prymnesium_polylepis.1
MSWACPGEVTPRQRAARPGLGGFRSQANRGQFLTALGSRAYGQANSEIPRNQRSFSGAPDTHAGTLPGRRRATLPFLR